MMIWRMAAEGVGLGVRGRGRRRGRYIPLWSSIDLRFMIFSDFEMYLIC